MTEKRSIQIENRCNIKVVTQSTYGSDPLTIARAVRADDNSDWIFGGLIDNKMVNIGTINSWVPERLQRSLILTIMKEFL